MGKDSSQTERTQWIRDLDECDLPRDENGEVKLPDDITYAEFLHLAHPELTEAQLRQAIAKEKAAAWSVRFAVLGFVVLIALIVWFAAIS